MNIEKADALHQSADSDPNPEADALKRSAGLVCSLLPDDAGSPSPWTGTELSPGAEPSPGAETEPSPGAEIEPSPGAETEPSPGAGTEPSPGAETEPSPSAETEPSSPGAGTEPSPGAGTEPSPGAGLAGSQQAPGDSKKGHVKYVKYLEDDVVDEELSIPRQHGRLDALLNQIPKKAQHGLLMQCDLILTCIDANDYFIALGTNIGLTFLYNRRDHSMQRLKSEATSDVITCIKLHHGVDHQLATGMASGALCIYLIPSFMSLHKKQLQKFDVRSVHRHYVTCVEWSTNGMKLFSGDKTGHVVVTEVDFFQGECKSSLLLVEPPTEVVQLNYDHKVLLVSTKHRSFVCRLDTTCQLVQVGQKDRKTLGNFGACFVPGLCKTEDAMLYAARPGLRIWLADMNGTVVNTHIFKDGLSSGVTEIPILSPSKSSLNPNAERQFGQLQVFQKHQVVTYNTTSIFILDPQRNVVVASQNCFGGVVDVAVHGQELFVLRRNAEDSIIRIATKPEVVHNSGLPFDLPVYASPATNSVPTPMSTVTSKMIAATSVTSSPSGKNSAADSAEEESRTKMFLKRTFLNPFKKLENFVQEHKIVGKESQIFSSMNASIQSPNERPTPFPTSSSLSQERPSTTAAVADHREARNPSPDLPPIVSLHSPDLAVRVFTAKQPNEIQSPDSADSALTAFASDLQELEWEDAGKQAAVRAETQQQPAAASAGSGPTDIVFSRQMGKKQKKKNKTKKKEPEAEAGVSHSSQNSGDSELEARHTDRAASVATAEDSEVDGVLRRADEALSSIGKLLKGEMKGETHVGQGNENAATTNQDQPYGSDISVMQRPLETASENRPVSDQKNTAHLSQPGGLQSLSERTDAAAHTNLDSDQTTDHVMLTHISPEGGYAGSGVHTLHNSSSVQAGGMSAPLSVVSSVINSNMTSSGADVLTSVLPPGSRCSTFSEEADLAAVDDNLDSLIHRRKVTSKDLKDDFYTSYTSVLSPDCEPESPVFTAVDSHPLSLLSDTETGRVDRQVSDSGSAGSGSTGVATLHQLANTWTIHTAPANIYSLALSDTHIWFTDKSENLHYSALGGSKGILWRKVGDSAGQISVSPSGHIVWRLHRGRAFAGDKITARHPEGLKWVEAVRDVAYISVDNACAWYVKINGEVMMQRGLSKERPCFRSISVETQHKVKQVMARYGVVWAITDALKLLVRTGISSEIPHGMEWREINRENEPFLFSNVTVDNEGFGWAVDVLGQIWFTDRVTPQQPWGSGSWWQVPLSEYIMQDPSVLDMLRSLAKRFDPQKFSHILSSSRGGLIAAGVQGVWLSLDYLNSLYVCRGSLQGYQWSLAQPSKMAAATAWKQVCASASQLDWGMTWAQSVNGELYAMQPNSSDAVLVPAPLFVSFSVNEHAVWGLTADGEINIRTGMGAHCPLGVEWTDLIMDQLGDVFLVHLCCNSSFVWVVDADGQVFHRIGAAPLRPGQLNPVWLPIDSYSEMVFTKVVNGPQDWMVWAIDNRRLTYVREGVSDQLPIGKEWVHVPGIQAMDITVSKSGVWSLTTNGEIYFRCGITQNNMSGDYWKKIPGCFTKISASANDVLWAINTEGQLVRCTTRQLYRRQDSSDPLVRPTAGSVGSDDGGWELV